MRRFFAVLLLFALVSASAFADDTSWQKDSKSMQINGYYKRSGGDKKVILEIQDVNSSKVYQTGTAVVDARSDDDVNPQTASSFSKDAFVWTLTGTDFFGTVSIKFTFTALMAYLGDLNDMYYVPAHRFTMTLNDGSDLIVDNGTDVNNQPKTSFGAFEKSKYENYSYAGYDEIRRWITYTCVKDENGDNPWVEGGTCSIDILDYYHMADVTFRYTSNVEVEFSIN